MTETIRGKHFVLSLIFGDDLRIKILITDLKGKLHSSKVIVSHRQICDVFFFVTTKYDKTGIVLYFRMSSGVFE